MTLLFLVLNLVLPDCVNKFYERVELFANKIPMDKYSKVGTVLLEEDTLWYPSLDFINGMDSILKSVDDKHTGYKETNKLLGTNLLKLVSNNDSNLIDSLCGVNNLDGLLILKVISLSESVFEFRFRDTGENDYILTEKPALEEMNPKTIPQKTHKITLRIFGGYVIPVFDIINLGFNGGGELLLHLRKRQLISISYQKGSVSSAGWTSTSFKYSQIGAKIFLCNKLNNGGIGVGVHHINYSAPGEYTNLSEFPSIGFDISIFFNKKFLENIKPFSLPVTSYINLPPLPGLFGGNIGLDILKW
ncbi:MAG: hypothetical protein WC614_12650 [bacterium]